MSNEWMDQEAIYIVNQNHEAKRNLEALKRKGEGQSMQRNQRYVSRAEKQIVGFMILVLAGLTGLALTVTGHTTGGFIAYAVAFLGLAIASHYE